MERAGRWLLLGLAVLYLLCLRAYYVGFFNDDAFYIIGARSLLSGGYRELNAPGAPPLVNYLPGYALLLAPVAWLFQGEFLAFQLLSVAFALGGVVLVWRCLAEDAGREAAFLGAAAAACSPLAASLSGTVLSEVPYFFFSLLALASARRRWGSASARTWAGLGALAGFCVLLRPTGAALALALAAALACERRWKEALWSGGASAVVVAPFLLRNRLVSGRPLMYAVELADPYGTGGASALAAIAGRNARYYAHELGRALFRWPAGPGEAVLEAATLLAGAAALAVGLRRWGLRGWRKLLPLYLCGYAAAHLLWSKQAGRYLYPVLALLAVLLLEGLRPRRKVLWGAGVLSLVLSAAPVALVVRASLFERTPVNTPPRRTLAWIAERTAPETVFAAEIDGRWHLLTGRRFVHLRRVLEPEAFRAWLRASGAGYVLVFPNDYIMTTASGRGMNDPVPVDALEGLLAGCCEKVFADAAEGARVYRAR